MFTDEIKKELSKKLSPEHVKTREGFGGGGKLSYLEGWFVIQEANRIFGFDGWSRRLLSLSCVGETASEKDGRKKCKVGYRATVEIEIDGVVRCGTGFGNSVGNDPIDIHELAIKEAETDAMKRAFATFGYPLGLALYDKTREHVGVDTTDEDEAREKLKGLIVNATPEQQAWFSEKYGAVAKVPAVMLNKLIERLEATTAAGAV